MRWEMEILSPESYLSGSNWLFEEESRGTKWTAEENKMFENALAVYDKETADRWQKVAAMIPGKTVGEVMRQYKELEDDVSSIEAGLIPIPGYSASPFSLEWGNGQGFDGFRPSFDAGGRRSGSTRPSEQERKKGLPWTEDEHRLFLMGLKKYGKGDWKNISHNFVTSRTPTQVASHAQKYFIRQLSGGKDKRRASIHDITTVNLHDDNQTLTPENQKLPSPDHSPAPPPHHNYGSMAGAPFPVNQSNYGSCSSMGFNPTTHGIGFGSARGIDNFGVKKQAQNQHRMAVNESHSGHLNTIFQMQSTPHYPHG
ncbi:hypothetical protein U1Q18_020778 [Sarracenia purpurea var. burkii]